MTTPKEALEAVLSFLDELAANAAPGKRQALNPITIGGSAKPYAEGLRASLQGEDAVERVARVISRAMLDNPTGGTSEERAAKRRAIASEYAAAYVADCATGLVPGEAAIRANERERQRERDAETADCMADEYDATSFTSTNAEQVAALRSKEQAALDIAAAIRSGGGK